MVTAEEREEIIVAAVERTLLAIPEVIGNLMVNHAMMAKINKEFYDKNKEFIPHKDVVRSVVEKVEGFNTVDDYDKILKDAVPEIKRVISTMKSMDTKTVPSKPNLGEI